MDTYVIIVAGGKGSRMAAAQPKQFLPLNGKAILHHTLEAFHRVDPTFKYIVVLPAEHMDYWKNHCAIKKITIPHQLVEGGSERFHSVKNALSYVAGNALVLIHDGVRPLVSKQTIKNVIQTANTKQNAIPVLSIVDSVREKTNGNSIARDRNNFVTVQTPQGFHSSVIKKAYEQNFHSGFTDDATVVEALGETINLVEGNKENIKITTPADLELAAFYLQKGF